MITNDNNTGQVPFLVGDPRVRRALEQQAGQRNMVWIIVAIIVLFMLTRSRGNE